MHHWNRTEVETHKISNKLVAQRQVIILEIVK